MSENDYSRWDRTNHCAHCKALQDALDAKDAEIARLRGFVKSYADQPCSCGVIQGTMCSPCRARQALS